MLTYATATALQPVLLPLSLSLSLEREREERERRERECPSVSECDCGCVCVCVCVFLCVCFCVCVCVEVWRYERVQGMRRVEHVRAKGLGSLRASLTHQLRVEHAGRACGSSTSSSEPHTHSPTPPLTTKKIQSCVRQGIGNHYTTKLSVSFSSFTAS